MDGFKDNQSDSNTETPKKTEKARTVRFIGSFNHSLDTKGRLVIPQNFREKLGGRALGYRKHTYDLPEASFGQKGNWIT